MEVVVSTLEGPDHAYVMEFHHHCQGSYDSRGRQQQQHGPYTPLTVLALCYPAKYNQLYSPSYHYLSPNIPIFTLS